MDDMYFSDNEKRKNKSRPKMSNDHIYSDDDFQDEYSERPEQNLNKRFVVNIPQDENLQLDRRPKGRPVQSNTNSSQVTPRKINSQMPEYIPAEISDNIYSSNRKRTDPIDSDFRKPTGAPIRKKPNQPVPNSRKAKPPKKKKKKLKVFVAVLCVIVLCLATLLGYGWMMLGKLTYDEDFKDENSYMSESDLKSSGSVKNILFLGSDARSEIQGQRSDTMILFSIDKKHHKIKMTSFLRDSYVYIPSEGYKTKLNAAFAYGGPQLLIDTLEYNFGVKIDDYVLIDFEGFKKLIDLMGGLTIDGVTEAEAKYMRDVVKIIYIKEGTNHMTGAASLWYCRIRYLDNDFKRTERQRKVISAIIDQMLHTNPIKLAKIVEEVLPMVTTSMDRNSLIPVVMSAVFNFIGSDNPQHQVPADGTWSNQRINGQDMLVMDMDENIELLKEFLYSNVKSEKSE